MVSINPTLGYRKGIVAYVLQIPHCSRPIQNLLTFLREHKGKTTFCCSKHLLIEELYQPILAPSPDPLYSICGRVAVCPRRANGVNRVDRSYVSLDRPCQSCDAVLEDVKVTITCANLVDLPKRDVKPVAAEIGHCVRGRITKS